MEVGIDPAMPTYAGGLGVLAGDTLRGAADLGVPMVGVTLLNRKGYFHQRLDARGNQLEEPVEWHPEELLEPARVRASVTIEGRPVQVAAWRYVVRGNSQHAIPLYLLDTALPENAPEDRGLTDCLYGGDERYRLCQEAVLGLGGISLLRRLGYSALQAYHMNEGHSALITLALLEERTSGRDLQVSDPGVREAVRQRCVFTTHTPVPAALDRFPMGLVRRVLGEKYARAIEENRCCPEGTLNMTYLALSLSHYVNGVSMRHEEVSQDLFPRYPINYITNGVHASTWVASSFARLYDRRMAQWRRDNRYLRYAIRIPAEEIWATHVEAKQALLREVEARTGHRLNFSAVTLGFARRATAYKRADLLFSDLDRLRRLARERGPLQVILGGKAHPRDEGGKAIIRRVFEAAAALEADVPVVYLEEYDMALAKLLCSGVDLWLNTPHKPWEASGTSGMKAALNGVPSLSVLDGWWVEGHIEGVTGWAIEDGPEVESDPAKEVASLYQKLEAVILPLYRQPPAYARVMRSTIAFNGSFFNAQRMVSQYLANAYRAPRNGGVPA